jgi:hypothetical protein
MYNSTGFVSDDGLLSYGETKPGSGPDDKAITIDAGCYLKERNPTQGVTIRDSRDGSLTVIGWQNGKAFVEP